jgi:hypothetical protein
LAPALNWLTAGQFSDHPSSSHTVSCASFFSARAVLAPALAAASSVSAALNLDKFQANVVNFRQIVVNFGNFKQILYLIGNLGQFW